MGVPLRHLLSSVPHVAEKESGLVQLPARSIEVAHRVASAQEFSGPNVHPRRSGGAGTNLRPPVSAESGRGLRDLVGLRRCVRRLGEEIVRRSRSFRATITFWAAALNRLTSAGESASIGPVTPCRRGQAIARSLTSPVFADDAPATNARKSSCFT